MECPKTLLTEEDCSRILSRYIEEVTFTYRSHTVKSLPSLEGLIGKHYNLKILYEKDGDQELNVFLKELNTTNKVMQGLLESIKAYGKEEFYYTHLLNKFKSYDINVDFAPICYYSRVPLLAFEDLSLRGYVNCSKMNMLDVNHCKVALKALAKFHAATISYEKFELGNYPNCVSLLERYPEYLNDTLFGDQENAATKWLGCTFRGLLALIPLLPKSVISADEYKSKLIEIFELGGNSTQFKEYKSTVLHGDLWSNNFMFKYENDVPVDSILIDYQIIKYGPIALDVNQMVLTNVRRNIRNKHYKELINDYYDQFVDACKVNGFPAAEFISYSEFMESCEKTKVLAKLQCVADHSVTLLMEEAVAVALQTEEGMRSFLFEDRSRDMVLSYTENEFYREIITEDLIEIRDLLFDT